jgi:hypothetical protein
MPQAAVLDSLARFSADVAPKLSVAPPATAALRSSAA